MIDGGRRNPAAAHVRVVGAVQLEGGELTINLSSGDGPPQAWSLPSLEVGWNVRLKSDSVKVVTFSAMPSSWVASVEGGQCLAELRIKIIQRSSFAGMRVKASQRAEEDLALHAQHRLDLNNLRDVLKLRTE